MKKTFRSVIFMMLLGILFTGLILFLPAGSFLFWQGWLFMGIIFIPFTFVISYFIKNDPALLERRMKFKEKEHEQSALIKASSVFFFIGFLIPGLDYRFGWSNVPPALSIISCVIIFLSYLGVFYVMKANSYASRVIEVEKDQKVISNGPYAIVRHPMYTAMLLMFLFMPTALGSYWALIPFLPLIPIIVLRIFNEEKVLSKDLKGYTAYLKKVKFRLIPGIW